MNSLKAAFDTEYAVKLAPGEHPYTDADVAELLDLCLRLPVGDGIGEENRVTVGRIIVDPVDVVRYDLAYAPAKVEDPKLAEQILKIAASEKAVAFWRDALELGYLTLRRAQANFLTEGGEVTWHSDHESNPDYRVSIIVSLVSDYSGGDFMAVLADEIRKFRLEAGEVLITKPDIQHGVTPVESGRRITLVMFIA
jgi:2OG-Fe(II) oxygenase superfamily